MKTFRGMKWLYAIFVALVVIWSAPVSARFIAVDPKADQYPSLSPYVYCANNPLKNRDPNGEAIETVVDVISIGFSAKDLYDNPSWANAGWLALDVGCAVVPVLPAAGAVRHSGKIGDLLQGADKVTDAAKKVPNPNGRVGGTAHKAGVAKAEAKADIDFAGQKVQVKTEGKIDTPGGAKSTRFGDVVVYKNKKPVKAYQIGDVLKDGSTPISRERKALKDIERQQIETEFLPKD